MNDMAIAVLTIAGTDPSGREGIQADLKTFAAHGCHGTSVVTAVTATTPHGVHRSVLSPDVVTSQITSTLADVHVHAIKTGTLFDATLTRVVATALQAHFDAHGRVPLVCDSVDLAAYGAVLADDDVHTIVARLFPLAHVVTLREVDAQHVLDVEGRSREISSLHAMLLAARELLALGARAALLKGGPTVVSLRDVLAVEAPSGTSVAVRWDFSLEGIEIVGYDGGLDVKAYVVDVLCKASPDGITYVLYPRRDGNAKTMQGADVALSAALACSLGSQLTDEEAVAQATKFTQLGIETASQYGRGAGPLIINHFHSTSQRTVPPKTSKTPYPLMFKFIQNTAAVWKQYVRHDFVVQLGKGTLDPRCFQHFIQQDYLYLKYYARAYALLASKSNDFPSIYSAARAVLDISNEISDDFSRAIGEPLRSLASKKKTVHALFCTRWGMTLEDLEKMPESPATTAYGAFLIDTGLRGDASALVMAVAACLLGYGEVGLWLKKEAKKPASWVVWEDNPYREWMEGYSGERYQADVASGLAWMERLVEEDAPSQRRYDEWFSIWDRTVHFEKGFWDMALNLS